MKSQGNQSSIVPHFFAISRGFFAACCGMSRLIVAYCGVWHVAAYCGILRCVACCGMLWHVAACRGMLWHVTACCSTVPRGVVTFSRRSVPPRALPRWRDSERELSLPLHVNSTDTIEDADGLIQVDFANKYV